MNHGFDDDKVVFLKMYKIYTYTKQDDDLIKICRTNLNVLKGNFNHLKMIIHDIIYDGIYQDVMNEEVEKLKFTHLDG